MPKILTDAELAECKAWVDERIDAVITALHKAEAHPLQIIYADTVWRPFMYAFHQSVVSSNPKEGAEAHEFSQVMDVTMNVLGTLTLEVAQRVCPPEQKEAFEANLMAVVEGLMDVIATGLAQGPQQLGAPTDGH